MKYIFLLLSLFFISNCFGQKITINPDIIVSRTDFDITIMEDNGRELQTDKANMILDEVSKNKLDVYVLIRGYAIWGLHINISKDSIKPEYYHWDDGGGHEKHLKFDSYDLTLNARSYKVGERLVGKFKGIATETQKDGKIVRHKLNGKFIHIIKNTREYLRTSRAEEEAQLSRKKYRETGIYGRMDLETGLKIKAPAYKLANSEDEYYLYATAKEYVSGLHLFSKAIAEPDAKKPGIMVIKLILEDRKSLSGLIESSINYGLVIDDTLWYVGDGLTIENGCAVFPLKIKKEKAAELVSKLNFAIQKYKKSQRKMQYTQKHPE